MLEAARADAIIRDAVAQAGDIVVAAGGDGTVSSVAAAVAGTNIALGVLPFGTLNHFAKDLHIPLDAAEAVKTIVARHVVAVDVGYVNERAFINNSSIGVYPDIVERRETLRRQGRNKWTALAIATADVVRRGREVFVRVDVEGRAPSRARRFCSWATTSTPLKASTPARVRGSMEAGCMRTSRRGCTRGICQPRCCGHGWDALGSIFAFATIAAAEMWIETPHNRTIRVATDGEVTRLPTPLHYRMAAGALKVIVPQG